MLVFEEALGAERPVVGLDDRAGQDLDLAAELDEPLAQLLVAGPVLDVPLAGGDDLERAVAAAIGPLTAAIGR